MSFSTNSALKARRRSFSLIPSAPASIRPSLSRDRALDRHAFRAFRDRCNDRAAEQIAAVKRFLSATAQRHFEKFVFVAAGKLFFDNSFH